MQQRSATSVPVVDTADAAMWAEPASVLGPLLGDGVHVARTTQPEGWLLLGADHVQQALADPTFGAPGAELLLRTGWQEGPYVDWFRRITVHMNPPDHTRLRSLVSRAFTPRAVSRYREVAHAIAHERCDELAASDRAHYTERFARLLPLRVICELLGIRQLDTDRVGQWSSMLGRAMSGSAADLQKQADDAVTDFTDYVRELIEQRRADTGDDLLSQLIAVEEGGDRLTEEELVILTMQLIFAGHETTQTLLSTGLWRLLQNPDQLQRLRDDPSLIPNAVDELLRLDPPAVVVARIPVTDVEIAGQVLTKGEFVTLSLFSANHDPMLYDQPDKLDVTRNVERQFAFGFGAHFCIGNHLARVEAATALEVLLERFATIEEVGTSRWVADTLRGRADLWIKATAP